MTFGETKSWGLNPPVHVIFLQVEIAGHPSEKAMVAAKRPERSEKTYIQAVKTLLWNHFLVKIFLMTKREIILAEILVHNSAVQYKDVVILHPRTFRRDMEEEIFITRARIMSATKWHIRAIKSHRTTEADHLCRFRRIVGRA